ncbi:MAG TPA: VanZ family protein [Caproiciproducens sp.]|nr:VanZ family protein [Caproiciproducens sp.]
MSKIIQTIPFRVLLHFPYLINMAIGLGVYIVCLILFFRHKKPFQNLCLALLFMYLAIVAAITLSFPPPGSWHISARSTALAIKSIQWVPFLSAGRMLHNSFVSGNFHEFIRIIGGNLLLLMPLGILVPLINPRFRIGRMILLAVAVPVFIEGMQLVGNILIGRIIRTVEVEDVVLNAAGCLIAYLIFAGFRKLFQPKNKAKHMRKRKRGY